MKKTTILLILLISLFYLQYYTQNTKILSYYLLSPWNGYEKQEPFFTLYQNGDLIFQNLNKNFYYVKLNQNEITTFIKKNKIKEIVKLPLKNYYYESASLDMPDNLIIIKQGFFNKKIKYYGFISKNSIPKEMPLELFDFIKNISNYSNKNRKIWIPEKFELILFHTGDKTDKNINLTENLPYLKEIKLKTKFDLYNRYAYKYFPLNENNYLEVLNFYKTNRIVYYKGEKYALEIKRIFPK